MHVALTGGIATGKSTVGQVLRAAGLATVDADQLARTVVEANTPGLHAVVARFGATVLTAAGTLDRAALATIVFADAAARADLERILHPLVRAGIATFFARVSAAEAPGVAEIPLVYETGWAPTFDIVVVAACHPATQRRRLMARDHLSPAEAEQRLAAQWPIDDKVRLADAVVDTEGDLAATVARATRLAAWLRGRSRPS